MMPNTSASTKCVSYGPDDQGTYQESAPTPGQYPSEDLRSYPKRKPPPSDLYGRVEDFSQPYDPRPRVHGPSSKTATKDGGRYSSHKEHETRGPENDPIRHDNRERGANMGPGDSSRHGRDGYNGRSRPNEGANPSHGENNSPKGWSVRASIKKLSAGVVGNLDEANIPSDERELKDEAHIQSLQQQIQSLKAQIDVHKRTIEDLRGDVFVEAENSKKIKESANQMAYAMESKDLYVGRQDSDDAIYSRFQILIGNIKTWSVAFVKDRPPSHLDFAAETVQDFQKVAPAVKDFSRFLQTPKDMRLFVRGYVSLAIAEMLFRTLPTNLHPGSGGEDIWMDKEVAHGVFAIENSLFYADRKLISPRELHDWRALTTTLISRLKDVSDRTGKGMEACITQCSSRIMSTVGHWVSTQGRRVLEEELLLLLFQAVKFSQTLRCQRAYWSVRHSGDAIRQRPQSGLPEDLVFFDKTTMDNKHGDEDSDEEGAHVQYRKIVEIFVTPGLFKNGNSDGERFDIETCVERSEVKCRTTSIGAGHPGLSR